jgi:hypothetical protein
MNTAKESITFILRCLFVPLAKIGRTFGYLHKLDVTALLTRLLLSYFPSGKEKTKMKRARTALPNKRMHLTKQD